MRSLPFAALLSASAYAQSSTITSTIPVCPTAASVTITLPTTVTFCPGPHCNGGGSGPQITPPPTNGVGMPGVNVGQYTSVGSDGKTTVLGIWETVYDSMCESGLVPATYTITQECPCEATPHPTALPSGFETTVVPCSVCAHPTVTLTQPCPTGPYASQTPSVGQPPALPVPAAPAPAQGAPAPAQGAPAPVGPAAGANAGAGADAGASAGSGSASPAASAGAGSGSGAAAQAGPGGASASAGSGAGASAQAGPGAASAGAGSGAGSNAGTGPEGASANAGSGSGASAQAGPGAAAGTPPKNDVAVAPIAANGTLPNMPASNLTHPGAAPIQSYVSSARQVTFAGLTLFVGVITSFLL